MTRNLYLGTDLTPILTAPSQPALFAAVGAAYAQVQANDFPARARRSRTRSPTPSPTSSACRRRCSSAPTCRRTARRRRPRRSRTTSSTCSWPRSPSAGSTTTPVSTFTGTDAELPSGLPPTRDVRLTDRAVVLVRSGDDGSDLRVSNPQSGAYPTALTVNTVVGPLRLPRGWASVDVKVRDRSFRFVTTHLDAFSSQVRNAQAAQLLTGPAATDLPVVVVGDTNSGPGTDLGAYSILTGGGLADAWVERADHVLLQERPAQPGPDADEARRPRADERRLRPDVGGRRRRGAGRPDCVGAVALRPRGRRRDAAHTGQAQEAGQAAEAGEALRPQRASGEAREASPLEALAASSERPTQPRASSRRLQA